MNGASRVRPVVDRFFHLLAGIAGIILLAMMVHVTADVVMKYVFRKPLAGTLEIVSAHYMVFSVFLPLGLVEWSRKSISVELFFFMFPRVVQVVLIALVLAIMSTVYAALAWQTWLDAVEAYQRNDFLMGGTVQIVIWQARFALPVGFGAACLVTTWQFLGVVLGFDRDSWLVSQIVDEIAPE